MLRAASRVPPKRAPAPIQRASRPAFEQTALLLQGGGALGAYQGGVYEALAEADLHPDWVAGISIGAINAALIAGNAPESRVAKLRAFWESVTARPWSAVELPVGEAITATEIARDLQHHMAASTALLTGAAGFFTPRRALPWLAPNGSSAATSFYDTAPLGATLERLVDFDRINKPGMRFSVGAVQVRTGNMIYFDNFGAQRVIIGPQHVMASGSLPPGFPAMEVDGELYWDGGIVSNTPLQRVTGDAERRDTLAFQVDLWSACGELPRTIAEVLTRQKEIQFSSRTRANSDRFKQHQKLRNALASLLKKLPPELRDGDEAKLLGPIAERKVYTLVQLIYRAQQAEWQSKDYEFSRRSMEDHWAAGYRDTVASLEHPEALRRPTNSEGVNIFDFGRPEQRPVI